MSPAGRCVPLLLAGVVALAADAPAAEAQACRQDCKPGEKRDARGCCVELERPRCSAGTRWAPKQSRCVAVARKGKSRALTVGATAEARLARSDRRLDDGSHYHDWTLSAAAGARLRITMDSDAFDAFLSIGRMAGGTFERLAWNDDGPDGTNSVLDVTIPAAGDYVIRANSVAARATGAYTLSVQAAPRPLSLGRAVEGSLSASSPKLDDGSHYEDWVVRVPGSGVLRVAMESRAFDTFLEVGRMIGPSYHRLGWNDDGPDGTNSLLEITVAPGDYVIRANSLRADATGTYTLRAEAGTRTLSLGTAAAGRLNPFDPTLGDGSFYQDWLLTLPAGLNLRITMVSDEFDAFVHFGRLAGGGFHQIAFNDDGPDGTHSLLDVVVPAAGEYAIRANSARAKELGAYVLTAACAPRPAVPPRKVDLGSSVEGKLSSSDPVLSDCSHYQDWVARLPAGARRITMRSGAFDTYLIIGQMVDGTFQQIAFNDDGPEGGTDSRLDVTLPRAGEYIIRANSQRFGSVGPYTLSVR